MLCCLLIASFALALVSGTTVTTESPSTLTRVLSTVPATGVGCRTMCCEGKNNTCHSTGYRLNGKGSAQSKCFCDEGCSGMGDCCFDYQSACTVVDCQMSEWSDYSECSQDCGIGTKSRSREIIVSPRFGGLACPDNLRETTVCTGTSCEETKVEVEQEIEKETAKIMPASFGRFRNMRIYNANMDIRKNLYYQYYFKGTNTYSGYCSRFRVVSSRGACQGYSTPWANVLKPGVTICVECQQTAMEKERSNGMCAGHGEVGVNTNWNAVNAPGCTGWWERLEDTEECNCGQDNSDKYDFIFI